MMAVCNGGAGRKKKAALKKNVACFCYCYCYCCCAEEDSGGADEDENSNDDGENAYQPKSLPMMSTRRVHLLVVHHRFLLLHDVEVHRQYF